MSIEKKEQSSKPINLKLIRIFFIQPNGSNFLQLLNAMKRESVKNLAEFENYRDKHYSSDTNTVVVKCILLMMKNPKIYEVYTQVTNALIDTLVEDKTNAFAWYLLGYVLISIPTINESIRDVFDECEIRKGKEALSANSYAKALSLDKTLVSAWTTLGSILARGIPFSDLSANAQGLFPSNVRSSWQEQCLYCYDSALQQDNTSPSAWTRLSHVFLTDISFDKLSTHVKTLFPANAATLTPRELHLYCVDKALGFDPNYAAAWNLLGLVFAKGTPFEKLSAKVQGFFPSNAKNFSPKELTFYCCDRALCRERKGANFWMLLNTCFSRGSRFNDLSSEAQRLFPINAKNFSQQELQLYCCDRALYYDKNLSSAWSHLKDYLAKGSRFIDLSTDVQDLFPSDVRESAKDLCAYCLSKANETTPQNNTLKRPADESFTKPAAKRQRVETESDVSTLANLNKEVNSARPQSSFFNERHPEVTVARDILPTSFLRVAKLELASIKEEPMDLYSENNYSHR